MYAKHDILLINESDISCGCLASSLGIPMIGQVFTFIIMEMMGRVISSICSRFGPIRPFLPTNTDGSISTPEVSNQEAWTLIEGCCENLFVEIIILLSSKLN